MELSKYSIGEHYHDKFDPTAFLQRYTDVTATRSQHMLRCFHGAFKDIPDDVTVLEYGSGPALIGTISAGSKASEIVLSDYLSTNRDAIRDWLDNKPDAFDWAPHFKYVVKELEGEEEEEVVKRQQRVRNIAKAVAHCDLTQDPPIEEGYYKPYDVVLCSLVLEAIAKSYEEYKALLSRMTKLVKPGGQLLLYGIENCTFYPVGDQKFHSLPLTLGMAKDAMEECGYHDIYAETTDSPFEKRTYMFFKATLNIK